MTSLPNEGIMYLKSNSIYNIAIAAIDYPQKVKTSQLSLLRNKNFH